MKNVWVWIGLLFLGGFVYWLTTLYPLNSDTWFHLASGRVFAEKGIIHYDVLSQAGVSRKLIPYEWFFQIVIYWLISSFGLFAYKIFIGIFAIINVGIFYLILRKIFQTKFVFSIVVSLYYALLVSSFFVGRPQLIAYTCLVLVIYILLLYLQKKKNFLWTLLPLTYLWSTVHPSIVVGIGIVFGYSVITAFMFVKTKSPEWLRITKNLILTWLGMSVVSILPPQGLMGYQYIFTIMHYSQFFSQNVIEWVPLLRLLADTLLYSATTLPILGVVLYVIYRKKAYAAVLWMVPFVALIFYGYTALRNTYFGYLSISILLGWLVSQVTLHKKPFLLKLFIGFGILIVYAGLIVTTFNRISGTADDNPEKAVTFLQQHIFEGNMFNQYDYGGYLEYHLYPKYKVFVDGRTDLFLCCELPSYFSLQNYILSTAHPNSQLVDSFFERYHMTYVILEVKNDVFGSGLSQLLMKDSNWVLVYWDDGHDIFVRKGTNQTIINAFGATAVTPFSPNPIVSGKEKQAFMEYSRMIKYADSAISRNALGYLYFLSGDLSSAKVQFQKAIALDNTYESGYSNLAEVMVQQQNYSEAIALYTQALTLNPNRPIIYIRLGQLYHATHDDANAKTIWEQGLSHIQDPQYKVLLEKYIQSLGN